jgi:phage tail sheath protein FI
MAFQLSPGVNVSEIDLTTIVPAVGTTEGAFAGEFAWGPINEIVTLSSEVELVNTFGKPDANTFVDFFTGANFLSYARNLKVVRATAATLLNATPAGTTPILIENETDYQENHSGGTGNTMWAAKWAGELGNTLRVSMYDGPNTANFDSWIYNGNFDGPPGTSDWAAARNSRNDELHIVVIDEDGRISGTANNVLERFSNLSKAPDAKSDDGSSLYYKDVINDSSRYIWWVTHANTSVTGASAANVVNWGTNSTAGVLYGAANTPITTSLTGGAYASPGDSDLSTAYDKFKNADEVDVSLIMTAAHGTTVASYVIDNIAEYRKDCVTFISPPRAAVVDNSGSEADDIITNRNLYTSSSYAVYDSGWKYQFDKYNNTYRWVPLNGDIAGLCVRTDFERDPWFSPAGFNRGIIRNVTKLAYNPDKTDRDELYKKGINPVVSFPGEGTILFGDKTMLSKPSAFDRINVRRLFIVLEKAIARASKFSLFEFNDAFTRAQFIALVEPYLRDVQGRRGIYDFRVVCDETNNTPEVIDRNEFIGDIYIKPARSINFIQLNFVAVRTGVSFDEVVGRF